jgi:GNAT superfamily N-acetyltransferase
MHYSGLARNEDERRQALQLAEMVFISDRVDPHKIGERKGFLMLEHPCADKDTSVIVLVNNSKVIGTAFIIDRILLRGTEEIVGSFISSICIRKESRGLGYSKILMDSAIEACNSRGSSIAIVIARRAVDHFYTKFGFWGVSQYSRFLVGTSELLEESTSRLSLRPAVEFDLPFCEKLHKEMYSRSFGHCVRNENTWRYIQKKLAYLQVQMHVAVNNGKIMGYAIYDESGNIHELAAHDSVIARGVLSLLAQQYAGSLMSIHIPPNHPVIKAMFDVDVTLSRRECFYGGHMVRILDHASLSNAVVRRVEQRARSIGLMPKTETAAGFQLEWDGCAASVQLDRPTESAAKTAFLLGAARISSDEADMPLDPPMSFNIPLVDQS